jgi:hypothetical protein
VNNKPMINEDLIQEFIEHRKELKRPMTPRAIKMFTAKLYRLESQGYCPFLLIERSVIGGWPSVYEHDSCKKSTQGFIAKVTDISWAKSI